MDATAKEHVEQCRNGHPDDYRFLVERYEGPVFAYLASQLGDSVLAEEAAQESSVRAFFALPKLKKPESFYAFLLGIAGRVAHEMRRAASRAAKRVRKPQNSRSPMSPRIRWIIISKKPLPPSLNRIGKSSCSGSTSNSRVRTWRIGWACRWGQSPKHSPAPTPNCARFSHHNQPQTRCCARSIECQENLVADLEGVLDPGQVAEIQSHLAGCPACRGERTKMAELRQRLDAHGATASRVALGPVVMGRIRRQQVQSPSTVTTLPGWLRWALGCGAATGAIVLTALLTLPKTTANADEVMARGARAALRLTSVHLQCRVRSAPADNFIHLSPKLDFTTVDLWKEWEGKGRWRIEKPGRVVVMDGEATIQFVRPLKSARTVPAVPGTTVAANRTFMVAGEESPEGWAPFDTGWLHAIADIEQTLDTELRRARAKGWPMTVASEVTATGATQAVVTIEASSGLPQGDYLHNKSFDTADTRRVYHFDDMTGRLQGVQVFLRDAGGEVLIFEVTHIAYNEVFAPGVFQLELPPEVVVGGEQPQLAGDDASHAGLTAEQAARRFFDACGREDWKEVSAFWPLPLDEAFKRLFGGLTVVSIGESFTSAAYPGRFVPYEIRLKSGRVTKHNLALKQDPKTTRWYWDGGL